MSSSSPSSPSQQPEQPPEQPQDTQPPEPQAQPQAHAPQPQPQAQASQPQEPQLFEPPKPDEAESNQPQQIQVRRAPKINVFLTGGFILGALVALFMHFLQPVDDEFGEATHLGFFVMLLGIIGLGLGALIWLFLDLSSKKKIETYYAQRTDNPEDAQFSVASNELVEFQQRRDLEKARGPQKTRKQRKAEQKEAKKARRAKSNNDDETDNLSEQ